MSQEISGSEKLKDKCQTIASLTPEEIAEVAGGLTLNLQGWWIRGIPADIFRQLTQPQVPAEIPTSDFGGFGF